MKKSIFLAVFACIIFSTTLFAQKGAILLGGNFGINSSSHDEIIKTLTSTGTNTITLTDKTVIGIFSPQIGYSITNNVMIGIEIGLTSIKETDEELVFDEIEEIEIISSNFSAGPFVRYTQPIGGIFSAYGQGTINIITGKSKTKYPGSTTNNQENLSGFGARIFPAIAADVGKGWSLNFSIGNLSFTSTKVEPDDKDQDWEHKYSTIDLSFNPQANIGISKMFGGTAK